ncbi:MULTISPECIES: RNA 2'-phosphotransferase [unclassified Pseudomonas]|uniref:RNA 2'-phosphotransferase n=1 Tax=unclassified Pseudomonas TaxID=196821 RepID=UPI00087751EB|nr:MULTISPECIES: RNA 2'-phosphotransferase [unclassified Pseudomonas]SCX72439.1 putative RNA 2'-phosphotransferase [Pseudomonas sp. NFACC32-1]SFY28892.1 putative RNA 2'-phosphotransferase [Pseudomonas sp. NFACC47-1]SFY42672.1 putative RNA 2'-phosphotransferase [Pseudomonas sp. NFACC43]
MTTKQQLNEASKFLSYILRHEPQAIGLQLDSEGWGEIESLIAGATKIGKALDIRLIHAIVSNSDKKRFSISKDGQRIRAMQGHSTTSVNLNHFEKTPPEFLYHGTARRFLDSIRQQGLIAGTRHYVHLSQDVATAVNVGQRYGSPIVIKIEALRMSQQGFKFFQADNGVWLISGIPADQLTLDTYPSFEILKDLAITCNATPTECKNNR